jgi:hypothetical protein
MKCYFVLTFLNKSGTEQIENKSKDIPKVDETIIIGDQEYRVFHITTNYDSHVKYVMCKPEQGYLNS